MADGEVQDGNTEEKTQSHSIARICLGFILWFVKDQWFLLGICMVIIISSQVQVPESLQATKQVAVSYSSGMFVYRLRDNTDGG